MTENTQQPQMTEEQRSIWVKEQFQKANKHLAENGVLFESVVTSESRYLAPLVAVWKIKATDNKFFWVISGDLPTDFVAASAATSAREAIKHFSLTWQLKAANLVSAEGADNTAHEYASMLVSRAEGLFAIQEQEGLWQEASA